ncbi:hypothetical protein KZX47_11675 [Thermus sp. SYSU G05001]|uniref:Uncharacterized protein n=1 Tax=Thermus brevis TaxID=2862456 RepID=A0ABS7A0F6_9DEIN|nr:hypothetical protein [Thermus brevis]MBW6395803.1 hypothetical protein [Thermus brevis]
MVKLRYNASEVKIERTPSWLILDMPDTRIALHKSAIAGFALNIGAYWGLFFLGLLLLAGAFAAWRLYSNVDAALVAGTVGALSLITFIFYRPASLRIYHTGGESLILEGAGKYKELWQLLNDTMNWRGQ